MSQLMKDNVSYYISTAAQTPQSVPNN